MMKFIRQEQYEFSSLEIGTGPLLSSRKRDHENKMRINLNSNTHLHVVSILESGDGSSLDQELVDTD